MSRYYRDLWAHESSTSQSTTANINTSHAACEETSTPLPPIHQVSFQATLLCLSLLNSILTVGQICFGSVADSTESPLNETEGHVLSLHIYVRKWFAESPMIVFVSASCI